MPITRIVARQIYDSRGKPTVEADVHTDHGKFRAAVPSGASTGIHEATELRDGGKAWMGQGVLTAVKNVNEIIAPALIGMDPTHQKEIDDAMIALDGTENKSKLGANAILAVSCAVSRAGAAQKGVPLYQHLADLAGNKNLVLPVPAFNVINGGVHAGNLLAMQEFMICPVGAASFAEAMQIGSEVYHTLRALLKTKYGIAATNVGDEGGFAPNITSGKEALDVIVEAIKAAGYEDKVRIGVDSAASEFLKDNGNYDLNFKDKHATPDSQVTPAQLGDLYKSFKKDYPMIFFEDPFGEDDWDPSVKFTAEIDMEVIGDDSLCTNPVRIKRAIEAKNVNSLLLKINQIGTVTESIEAVRLAKGAGWGVLTSHRSGETGDDFIADLSVALATGKIKSGAPARYERLAKYNQFLRIEEELGSAAKYAGWDCRYVAWEN